MYTLHSCCIYCKHCKHCNLALLIFVNIFISFRFLEKWIHESRKSENIIKVGKYHKIGGKGIWKTLNFVLMLVMRFLTNKQVFKTPSWYLTQTFWWKALKNMEKCGKRGEKYFFPLFYFILLKTNTNYAHMQNFIQIPQKMKTGVQNVFKLVKVTLPFLIYRKKHK